MEFDNRVCIGNIREDFYLETGTKPEDAENFVDYARSLEGVEIGVLLEDRNGELKGSFRAKDKKYRVDLLAKNFAGEVMPVLQDLMWMSLLKNSTQFSTKGSES